MASLLFGALALRQAGRLIDAVPLPAWLSKLGYVLAGGSWILGIAAANALETTMAAWLTTMLVVRLVTRGPRDGWLLTGIVGALCVLARPEALALVAALGAASFALARDLSGRERIQWTALPLGAWAAVEAARIAYYGQVLPNTYVAKASPLGLAVRRGVPYLAHAIIPGSGLSGSAQAIAADALVGVVAALLVIGAVSIIKSIPACSYVVVVVVVQVAFVIAAGGDWMIGGRFLAPVIPAAIVVEIVGLERAGRSLHARHGVGAEPMARFSIAVMVAIALVPLVDGHHPIWSSRGRVSDSALIGSGDYPWSPAWQAGVRLLGCAQSGDLVATTEIGYTGFARRDLRILDLRGLTRPAHRPRRAGSRAQPERGER